MATTTEWRRASTVATATCPYCGQPLLDQTAVRRLHAAEREQERRLDTVAQMKAAELTKKAVAKATADAEQKAARLQAQLAQRDREHTGALRRARTQAAAEAKAAASREAQTKVQGELKKLRRTVETLRAENEEQARRIENLSSEERGEFNEQQLVAELKAAFPDDRIERHPRGHTGADILHEVCIRRDSGLESTGTIVYECKDTLRWSNDFVTQARRSGATHHSPYLVVITRAFPRNEKWICVRDGVVIVHPSRLVHVAHVLRRMVEEVYRAGLTAEGQTMKTQELYGYLSSDEFREAVEALGADADTLDDLLSKERKWHEGQWAKRQRLYTDVAAQTSAVDARIRAIIERPAERATVIHLPEGRAKPRPV